MKRQNSNLTGTPSRALGLRLRVIASLAVALLAFPAAAVAQSPTDEQYDEVPPSLTTGGGGSDPSDPSDPSGLGGSVGPLPFTGFDLIAMVAVALTVTGVGLVLQRAVARESNQ